MGWGRCSIEALSLLKKAAAIRPDFDLRNEAIATLSLADVAPEKQWTNAEDSPFGPLAFDPTLQFCASALPGQTVSIWKFADRPPVCILKADDGDRTRACTLGPWDGTHLCLVTEGGIVRVYRTSQDGQARLSFTLPSWYPPSRATMRPGRIAFSPDGKAMAIRAAGDGGISLRDPDDGHELNRLAQGPGWSQQSDRAIHGGRARVGRVQWKNRALAPHAALGWTLSFDLGAAPAAG